MVEKLPVWKLIIFSLGQFGWSLVSFNVGNTLTYFYMPPVQNGQSAFPVFIFQGVVLGIATVIGLINSSSRIFDAVTDPLVANLSDRSKSKLGRRRVFMASSALPLALFAALVFLPPVQGESAANAAWLIVVMFVYYWFMTMYVTPYTALFSELGHDSAQRLTISTVTSVTWALGFAVGNQIYVIKDLLVSATGMTPLAAFQTGVVAFSVLAAVMMLLPVIFIDEKRYSVHQRSEDSLGQSLKSVVKEKFFVYFAFSDLAYWLSMTFIQIGISYYITILLGLSSSMISFFMLLLFLLSFVFYAPIHFIASRLGKKKVLIAAFAIFALVFALVASFGFLPLPAIAQAYLIIVLTSIPIAIFGILPNAIVADIAEYNGQKTGSFKAGIFYGARTFMMKQGIWLANFIFPSFLLLGKSTDNSLGIRLTAVAAVVFSLVGLFLFLKYDEKSIQAFLRERGEGSGKDHAHA
ncbi:MAG: MFS transporter [Spirochaetales bacterium]|nr:MFS transporter [Spirochaetales bacterium]